jgi:hypothetical protein
VSERQTPVQALDRSASVPVSERAKTVQALDRSASVTVSERQKTVQALDRSASVTLSERAKTVQALDRSATVTGFERQKADLAASVTAYETVLLTIQLVLALGSAVFLGAESFRIHDNIFSVSYSRLAQTGRSNPRIFVP